MLSGYKTITPIQFANAVWALESGLIDHHAVRVYLACFVLVAVREAADRTRRKSGRRSKSFTRYRIEELERLIRLSSRQVRRALRRLREAGLVEFSEGEIAITKDAFPESESLQTELACRRSPRRPIPVPRPMLHFLAQNRAEALTKVVIAYLIRGLSIARGTGEINPRGTAKASWIAQTFGLSHRAVKYAQATLRSLGWISKDTESRQRKLNRDGAYFTINEQWAFKPRQNCTTSPAPTPLEEGTGLVFRDKPDLKVAPPPTETAPDFAPPKEDRETSNERNKDQRTRSFEPSGVCLNGKAELRPPSLNRVVTEDLYQFSRIEALHREAVARNWIGGSEAMVLNFLAAAVRARERGRDPARLFVAIVRNGLWSHITQAEEDHAARALARFREDNPDRFRRHRETVTRLAESTAVAA